MAIASGSLRAVATPELRSTLEKFVTFMRSLKGDEKSEEQLFLDHFFHAFGHEGVQEAGATLEFRIAKKPGSSQLELLKGEDAVAAIYERRTSAAGGGSAVTDRRYKGGKKFADLLWPERAAFATGDCVRVVEP